MSGRPPRTGIAVRPRTGTMASARARRRSVIQRAPPLRDHLLGEPEVEVVVDVDERRLVRVRHDVDAIAEALALADERGARGAREPRVLAVHGLLLLTRSVGGPFHEPHEPAVDLAPV